MRRWMVCLAGLSALVGAFAPPGLAAERPQDAPGRGLEGPAGMAPPAVIVGASQQAEQQVAELRVRVQVQGAVRRPGVYSLPVGSRTAEGLARAGGPRADAQLQGLNLVHRLADGELVYVPTRAEAARTPWGMAGATGEPAGSGAPAPAGRRRAAGRGANAATAPAVVDLNTASAAQLDALPGIGPGLASAIVKLRQARGRFQALEELREVQGIGAKRLERLKPYLRVS